MDTACSTVEFEHDSSDSECGDIYQSDKLEQIAIMNEEGENECFQYKK